MERQRVLDVLNSLDVVESNGGEEAYILVENNEGNRELLNDVGVSTETINKYGDEETFCILALAFGEGFADWYENGEFIKFDKSLEVEFEGCDYDVHLFKKGGDVFIAYSEYGGSCSSIKLSESQINKIREIIA